MKIRKFIQLAVLCFIGLASSAALYAQVNVTGKVTDESGTPIPGVTVMIPGTTRGTSTGGDGSYSLNPGNSEELQFSCLGYQTQTIQLNGRYLLDVVLEEDTTLLNETVVVGYGVQKKVNLTGAVSVINSEDIENRSAVDLSHLLQGTMAGLNVTTTTGIPGRSASVNVRGYTSINGGDPLVMVDGAIGELDYVNPNDIESISVIKDASASAIYGGRAAFGVILITTKEAKEGSKPKVEYSGRWGWSEQTTSSDYETTGFWHVYTVNKFWYNRYGNNYVDYTDYDMIQLLARVNDKTENPDRPWVVTDYRNGRNQWVYYCNTDWWHSLFRDRRPYQTHNINISGSAKGIRYMLSGGYLRECGMMVENRDVYQKYNLRAKLDFDVTKWLAISNNTTFYHDKYAFAGLNSTRDTLGYLSRHALACFPLQNPDGTWLYRTPYIDYTVGNGRHATILSGDFRNEDHYYDFQNTTGAKITFTHTLSLNADFTYRQNQRRTTYRKQPWYYRQNPDDPLESYASGAGLNELIEYFYTYQYYTANAYVSYDETYNHGHHFSFTAGMNYEAMDYKRVGAYADYLISTELDDFALVGTNDDGEVITGVYGGQNDYRLMGFFARLNYDYKERYLIELSGRYDGTSRFAKGNRWGFFPSASIGWRISEEPFFEPATNVVDNLKIRASFGSLGNQSVSSYYTYMRLISTSNMSYSFGESSTVPKYASIDDPVAGDLTWEVAQQYDVGVDLTMFQNRLNFTGDAYIRNTIGMLTTGVELPSIYGADSPEMNAANLTTRGYELSLSWKDHFMLGGYLFEYSVGGQMSDYASYITKYNNPTKILTNYYKGERLGELWGYKTAGLFQSQEEVDDYLRQVDTSFFTYHNGVQVGDIRFIDRDGDGKLSNGTNTYGDSGDKTVIGNSLPSFQYGFNASVTYFGFDVSVFFQGTGNHYYYPNTYDNNFWGCFAEPFPTFLQKDFLKKCWDVDNRDAYFPRPDAYASVDGSLTKYNDRYLQNIRYLRLKNLTVGYTIPQKITMKAHISKIRVYFTGENLTYWSPIQKYAGNYVDPEAIRISNQSDNYRYDALYYPWSKSYLFGVDITF